jgi:phosphoglycerate dehydrogenase-like enzyme
MPIPDIASPTLTLGVIGLGRLGAKVAKVGKAYGMELLLSVANPPPQTSVP